MGFALAGILTACRAQPTLVLRGQFGPGADLRLGPLGTVAVLRNRDDLLVLELELHSILPGPQLEVRLIGPDPDGSDSPVFLVVGRPAASGGRIRFDLPPRIDLCHYAAVSIWDRARGASLATARFIR